MLQRLEIQNVAIIDKVEIELGDGLNVLTGETGAEVHHNDSINAILGQRLYKDLIRRAGTKPCLKPSFRWIKKGGRFAGGFWNRLGRRRYFGCVQRVYHFREEYLQD